jgi:hypothetical protein
VQGRMLLSWFHGGGTVRMLLKLTGIAIRERCLAPGMPGMQRQHRGARQNCSRKVPGTGRMQGAFPSLHGIGATPLRKWEWHRRGSVPTIRFRSS